MEHAKKLVLIDPRILDKLTSAKDKTLAKIENEMTDLLSADLPDDEKAKLYASSAKRHMTISAPDDVNANRIEAEKAVSLNRDVLTDVIRTVPPTHIPKAMKLVDFLKRNPRVDFNDRGELTVDKKVVNDTHAIDLINEVVRRKNMNANGSREFASILGELNCPKELIVNPTYKKYIQTEEKNRVIRRQIGSRNGRSSQTGSGKKRRKNEKKGLRYKKKRIVENKGLRTEKKSAKKRKRDKRKSNAKPSSGGKSSDV